MKSMPNFFYQNKLCDARHGDVDNAKVLKAFFLITLGKISLKTELKFKKTDIVVASRASHTQSND